MALGARLMNNEQWKPIPGYEGIYEVSAQGRVRSIDRLDARGRRIRGRVLKPETNRYGHLQVGLWSGGEKCKAYVHRLALLAFIGPPPEGMEGCHNDGNPSDNRLENLRWDTRSANMLDKVLHGTHHHANKTHCPAGHEYTEANTYVYSKSRGGLDRQCRACHRERIRAYRARKRAVTQQSTN